MTEQFIISSCLEAVKREREATIDVLRYLRKIDRRRLFSELNYKSLFDFCVRHLGYSEDQAYRRVNAMKLIKQIPEAEVKIEEGSLSLSNASLLQKMTAQSEKPFSKEEKLELMNKVENKSRREAEKILGDARITYHIPAMDEETDELYQQLRGLTAHKYKTVAELFKAMVINSLDEKHGLLPAKSSLAKKQRIMDQVNAGEKNASCELKPSESTETRNQSQTNLSANSDSDANAETNAIAEARSASTGSRALKFTNLKCTRCGSHHAPQTEHIIPRAKGGTDDPKNLTLLCRNCNQRAAIREFGLTKMDRYLNRGQADANRIP